MKPAYAYLLLLAALAHGPALALSADPSVETLAPTVVYGDAAAETPPNGRINLDARDGTGSRLGLTLRETPASVTVISREQIEARGAANTQDIARGIPGVDNASPPGMAGAVSYRGFSGSQISQLFNGISVQYDAIAARPIDSWIYDRVEAIGGPSTFLGAGAVGGAINYVTKLPERDTFYEGRFRLGSFNSRQYSVGLNQQLAGEPGGRGHYLRLDANTGSSQGWVDGNHSRASQLALAAIGPGSDVTQTWAFEYQRESRPPLLGHAAQDRRQRRGQRRGPHRGRHPLQELQRQRRPLRAVGAVGALDHRMARQPALTFKNTLYYYRADRDFRNLETYRFNAGNTQVLRSGALLQRHEQRRSATGSRACTARPWPACPATGPSARTTASTSRPAIRPACPAGGRHRSLRLLAGRFLRHPRHEARPRRRPRQPHPHAGLHAGEPYRGAARSVAGLGAAQGLHRRGSDQPPRRHRQLAGQRLALVF